MQIPTSRYPDSTIPLYLDPYRFIGKTCRRINSDLFFSRLMLKPTVFMTGKDAARVFYDESHFQRAGAAPLWLQKTLLGEGGVQTLDDERHKDLKRMFMSLTSAERAAELAHVTTAILNEHANQWVNRREIVLYDEFQEILTKAVCRWAGVALLTDEIGTRTKQLVLLFDQAASFGLGHVKSRRARSEAEQWIGGLIRDIRNGTIELPVTSPAYIVATFRESTGNLLEIHRAAVELLNLLRPTVAVAVYATFAALALHQNPRCRDAIASEPDYLDLFAQEVRRFFPFFPAVMAKVRQDFEWNGYRFRKDWAAVLDLYGINHDPRVWTDPEKFEPERFRRKAVCPFSFVPQGGGSHMETHRCPGELIASEIIKVVSKFLTNNVAYAVPSQRLYIVYSRLPALPRSGFIISNVKMKTANAFRESTQFAAPGA